MWSLTTISTRMETSVAPVYIKEAKANGQDVNVIEIALPPINSKHYLSILEDIHNALDHVTVIWISRETTMGKIVEWIKKEGNKKSNFLVNDKIREQMFAKAN
ncbi:14103_t:CDS:2 [Funneliformis caledonium]|uniref:14103_t:CDS:1 n=1 Tax=Funneliformis caledonium TaxID=1117310 RepID=A0A9N9AHV1_9GLOM|nr:14103_t:CDS:2 [Funneliformis caledonium]